MTFCPQPSVAWQLDGSAASHIEGAAPLWVDSRCNWTSGHLPALSALRLDGRCYASAAHTPSLLFGAGSLSVCARFRTGTPGVPLVAKLGALHGFSIAVSEGGKGLGVSLADRVAGISAHEDVGRTNVANGEWHHACAVLQRAPRPQLIVYVDGRRSETMNLVGSRLQRLGSLDSDAPLLLGRREVTGEADEARHLDAALREVAIWSRALLPEHVDTVYRNGLPQPSSRRHRAEPQRPRPKWTRTRIPNEEAYGASGGGSIFSSPSSSSFLQRQWAAATILLTMLPLGVGYALRRHRLHASGARAGRWVAQQLVGGG